ncbi:MAG: DUF222 domain-containing protein [Acidimicrobiia bacterium]
MEFEGAGWLGIDLDSVSTDELESELGRIESLKIQLTAVQLGLVAEADRRQVPLADGCRNATQWLAARLDVSSDDAKRLVGLCKRLPDLPEMADRFRRGELSLGRAAALSRVASADSETDWLTRTRGRDLAGTERLVARHKRITPSQERERHRSSFLWCQPSLDEAWVRVNGGLAGPAGQTVIDALGRRADQFPKEAGSRPHRQALALETICLDSLNGNTDTSGSGSGSGASITAFVDMEAASGNGGETGAELAAGSRIGPDYLQELWCEGTIRVVGLDKLRPVVATDATKTIPPSIRDFVLWRDGKCRARGCNSTYRLQPHHIHPRSHQGGHDPDNLITLCWYHHHVVVHRRGMVIGTDPDGSIRFHLPQDTRAPP